MAITSVDEDRLFVHSQRKGLFEVEDLMARLVHNPKTIDPQLASLGVPLDSCVLANSNALVATIDGYRQIRVFDLADLSLRAEIGFPDGFERVDGEAETARFFDPTRLARDSNENVYVIDGNVVRILKPDYSVDTYAGGGETPVADVPVDRTDAAFGEISEITATPDGTIYLVADGQILAVDRAGWVTSLLKTADRKQSGSRYRDGRVGDARSSRFQYLTSDAQGNLWYEDGVRIRRIDFSQDRIASILLDDTFVDGITGIEIEAPGQLLVSTQEAVYRLRLSDADDDRIPDREENFLQSPFRVGSNDLLLDEDGDGVSNAAEYHFGTDPLSSASVPQSGVRVVWSESLHSMSLIYLTRPGRSYRMQSSPDLATWTPLDAEPSLRKGVGCEVIDVFQESWRSSLYVRIMEDGF